MNYGFFTDLEMNQNRSTLPRSPQCGACGLSRTCKSPKMKYAGEGRHKIMIIGQAPGENEDRRGEPFVGKAGQRLQRELKRCGVNLNRDCWKTNAVRCHIKDNVAPDSKTIGYCRPALFQEIETLKPHHILLFGKEAAESVMGHLWGSESLTTWMDWVIPYQKYNCWISVHYHPSYLERSHDDLLDLIFHRGLKKAFEQRARPWPQIPDYESEVDIIYKDTDALLATRDMAGSLFAFDYETNCLKPEYKGAEIVSCAMSNGTKTFAFPWSARTAESISTLLKSTAGKIASNMKFEERWTRHFLGHRVRNWDWDTMLAAHLLNNREGVTGLKFQTFVLLGLPPYNKHVEPYLKSAKGNPINRIRELPLKDLLLYNGLDALLEYKIAAIQKRSVKDD
jgi:uracil-DNA glycosylase